MKSPGQTNLQRKKDYWLPKTSPFEDKGEEGGMGRAINEYGVFAAVGGDEEKVIVMTVAQLGEHTKNHYLYTFNQ